MADDDLRMLLAPDQSEVAVSGLYVLKERIGVALDVLWMLSVSVGVVLGAWPYWHGWALVAGGGLLSLLTQGAATLRAHSTERADRPDLQPPAPTSPPGPEDAGNLHVSGR